MLIEIVLSCIDIAKKYVFKVYFYLESMIVLYRDQILTFFPLDEKKSEYMSYDNIDIPD